MYLDNCCFLTVEWKSDSVINEVKIEKKTKKVKPEYEIGDLVVYGSNGVCRVEEITRLVMPGTNKKGKYYCLVPVDSTTSRIFALVGQDKIKIRRIISKEEALELIESVTDIPELNIISDKTREDQYKSALRSCNCREWFSIIKTLYNRNKARVENGRKITSTDERYLKEAKRNLYTELAVVLDRDKDEIEDFITEKALETDD